MLRTIIVDDEQAAIKTLEWELNSHCPEIQIIGQYSNPVEALEGIQQDSPDLIFLDIEMPRLNGFDLLAKIPTIDFDIIFVTAYDAYAVKAFRINAVDYLLKPIISTDLKEAIVRVKEKKRAINHPPKDNHWQIEKLRKSFNKIPLSYTDGIDFVLPHQILYCKSEGSYTYVVMEDRKSLITRTLREMEDLLAAHNFMRTHRSFIVNVHHISKYLRTDGGYLIMSNGDRVAVSRRKKEELMRLF